MKKFKLEIVSPDRLVVSEECDIVVAVGTEGQFAALPGHLPFLTALKTGPLIFRNDGEEKIAAVSGGVIEVLPDQVNVLADEAELAEEIDVERALQAKERAEALLAAAREIPDPDRKDRLKAEMALKKAINRIRTAENRDLRLKTKH